MGKSCNLVDERSTPDGRKYHRCKIDNLACLYFDSKGFDRCPRRGFLAQCKCPKCGAAILEE